MDPKQLIERSRALTSSLSRGQLASIAVVFVAVIGLIIGSAYYVNVPTWRLLFSDMDAEAAAQVVTRLESQKIPYQLDADGRSIRVPADKVDRLRLDFAGQGMPLSGRIGFEIFDRTSFGATEFLEQVNYRRALEGEIARTIGSIAEVAGARVHIAMAKDSLFGDREQPAKASVVLKLRNPRRPLGEATVNGISSLVAASVEGLKPDAVVIMDSFGRPLTRPVTEGDGPVDGVQLERQQRIERDLATRVVALLEPVVGEDRVRVNVSARLNVQTQEETEERWDPATPVVRSRQTSADGPGAQGIAQGLAGARGNLPAPATPAAPGAPAVPATATASVAVPAGGRMAETTNYEISRTTRHVLTPRGDVARLSVAVIVDNLETVKTDRSGKVTRTSAPRPPAEMQKIQGLVAAAVGIDATRGDQLTIENVAFDEPVVEAPASPGLFERIGPQVTEFGRFGMVLVLAVLAFVFIVRPILSRALPGPRTAEPVAQQPLKSIQDMQRDIEAEIRSIEEKASEPKKLGVLAKRVAQITEHEPEGAARLIRTWLSEEEATR